MVVPRKGAILIAMCSMSAQAAAESLDVGGGVTLASDYRFRGVSQTLGGAAAQAWIEAEVDAGFYGYVFASNVDFVPDGEPDDGARYEVNAALGFATELSDDWAVDAMLVRYAFPDTFSGIGYDYTEAVLTVSHSEGIAATAGYSNDVFGERADGWFYAISAERELAGDFSFAARAGFYDLGAPLGESYSFSEFGLSRALDAFDVSLVWHDTGDDARDLFYEEAIGSSLVLSLDFLFPR